MHLVSAIVLALLCLLMTGCTSTKPLSVGPAPGEAALVEPSTDMFDRLQSSWVATARESLALRTGRPVGVASLRAFDKACAQGKLVEIVASPMAAADALNRTKCVSVWRTSDPNVLRSAQVLLVDGRSLVVEGQLRTLKTSTVLQEARAVTFMKASGAAQRLR